jgi:hypothetical protein
MEEVQTVTLLYASFWMIITAIIFTIVGYSWGIDANIKAATEATIDALVAAGYIRTRKLETGEVQILKYWEEDKDEE